MKSHTDLEQSKKLAEILPIESADYYHATDAGVVIIAPYITYCGEERCVPAYKGAVPCWSLAALLSLIPQEIFDGEYILNITEGRDNRWVLTYDHYENRNHSYYGLSTGADNLVDACVDIIIKLKERNII